MKMTTTLALLTLLLIGCDAKGEDYIVFESGKWSVKTRNFDYGDIAMVGAQLDYNDGVIHLTQTCDKNLGMDGLLNNIYIEGADYAKRKDGGTEMAFAIYYRSVEKYSFFEAVTYSDNKIPLLIKRFSIPVEGLGEGGLPFELLMGASLLKGDVEIIITQGRTAKISSLGYKDSLDKFVSTCNEQGVK